MIVVADTTPINYLILIGQVDLLTKLFGGVVIPPAVFKELQNDRTPEPVRKWIAERPQWLAVVSLEAAPDAELSDLDAGEREAIALAERLRADRLLVDEMEARREAVRRNFMVIGTLGVLRKAAQLHLIGLTDVSIRASKQKKTARSANASTQTSVPDAGRPRA